MSRQYNKINDPLDNNPTDQRLSFQREDVSYNIGRLRLQLEHEFRRTEDKFSLLPLPTEDSRRGTTEYNHYDLNQFGLQSLSMRSDYIRFASNGTPLQKSISGKPQPALSGFSRGRLDELLKLLERLPKDLILASAYTAHNGNFNSTRDLRRGTLTNTLNGALTNGRGGSSRSAGATPSLNLNYYDGRVNGNLGAHAGWSRLGTGESYANDGLNGMLTLRPRAGLSFFAEGRTIGAEPLSKGAPGGSRTHRIGVGAGQHWYGNEVTARFERTYNKDYDQNFRNVSDQFNLQGSAVPVERMRATAGVTAATVRSNQEIGLTAATTDWAWTTSSCGVQLTADASYAGARQYQHESCRGLFAGQDSCASNTRFRS